MMRNLLDTIKPEVQSLRAYTLPAHRTRVKLNQNENPWDAPERIKEETLRRLGQRRRSRYPDFVPASLNKRLADFAGWKSDGAIAGNGSHELLQSFLMVSAGPGTPALTCGPPVTLYRLIPPV